MMGIRYTINDKAVAEALAAKGELLDAALLEAVGSLGTQLLARVQSKIAPVVRTAIGQEFLDSIQMQAAAVVDHVCSTSVGIDDEGQPSYIVAYVREFGGEKWYDIYPVNAKALHFIVGEGAEVFTRHVRHPPAIERSYLRSSLAEIMETGRQQIAETIAGVLNA